MIMTKTFIHEKAFVDKEVKLGEGCSVWPGASVRSDEGEIVIGKNTSVQDNVVIHGRGVVIGDNVTVGHGAIIHGSKIGSNVLIGMGAIVLNGCEIGDWSIIAAGALLTEGTVVDKGTVMMGIPAKPSRKTEDSDKKYITHACKAYLDKV